MKSAVACVEFQKRGLPHCHLLAILEDQDAPKTTEDFDRFTCAEIPPDREGTKELRRIVLEKMVHDKCGTEGPSTKCWDREKRRCRGNFPKDETEETNLGEDGYTKLRRREMPEKDHVDHEQFGVDDDGNGKEKTVKINNQ